MTLLKQALQLARFMRGEWFTFLPKFKIFLSTNHRPVISGTDAAIWDRIRLIPFNVRIDQTDRKPDKDLPKKLKAEADAILMWALEGLAMWKDEGLNPPSAVMHATRAYRKDEDVLERFIEERCRLEAGAWVPFKSLHDAYEDWARANGEELLSGRALGAKLNKKNIQERRNGQVRGRYGIRLLEVCDR